MGVIDAPARSVAKITVCPLVERMVQRPRHVIGQALRSHNHCRQRACDPARDHVQDSRAPRWHHQWISLAGLLMYSDRSLTSWSTPANSASRIPSAHVIPGTQLRPVSSFGWWCWPARQSRERDSQPHRAAGSLAYYARTELDRRIRVLWEGAEYRASGKGFSPSRSVAAVWFASRHSRG